MITMIGITIVVSVLYVLWRFNSASRSWDKVANKLNNYLSEEHPEFLKLILVAAFEDSMKNTLPLQILLQKINRAINPKPLSGYGFNAKDLLLSLSDEERDMFLNLLSQTIKINIRLSPILWVICFFAINVIQFISFLCAKNESDKVLQPNKEMIWETFASDIYSGKLA